MDASRFEACLDKTNDTPETVQLLADLGVSNLKPSSEAETRVSLPKVGLSLVFAREDRKSSKLKLIDVEFHAGDGSEKVRFSGALPKGLSFDDTKDEVRKKLGEPTIAKDKYRVDHWINDGRQLSVKYHHETFRILTVHISLPI